MDLIYIVSTLVEYLSKSFNPEVLTAVLPFCLDLPDVVKDSDQITYNDRRLFVWSNRAMLNNTTVAAMVSVLPLSARISSGKGFKPEVQPAVFTFHLDLPVVVKDSDQIRYNDRRLLVRTCTAIINIKVAAVVSVLPLPPRISSRIVSLVEVKEENRRLREQISCNHCQIRPKEVVYIPCGHFLYCSICDRLLYHTNCPLCNARIRGWVFV